MDCCDALSPGLQLIACESQSPAHLFPTECDRLERRRCNPRKLLEQGCRQPIHSGRNEDTAPISLLRVSNSKACPKPEKQKGKRLFKHKFSMLIEFSGFRFVAGSLLPRFVEQWNLPRTCQSGFLCCGSEVLRTTTSRFMAFVGSRPLIY